MRCCNRFLYDSFTLVSDGCNERLTNSVSFVRVIRAVRLTITEPCLGDTGVLVETVKLPYITQDGL